MPPDQTLCADETCTVSTSRRKNEYESEMQYAIQSDRQACAAKIIRPKGNTLQFKKATREVEIRVSCKAETVSKTCISERDGQIQHMHKMLRQGSTRKTFKFWRLSEDQARKKRHVWTD